MAAPIRLDEPPTPGAVPPQLGHRWDERRAWITHYFDRTASAAWAKLTSDAPVSGIRRTVREGREQMRRTLSSWLPADLTGARVLDAGCGPGVFAMELAARGAHVVAVDVSPTLVGLAQERAEGQAGSGRIDWRVGDMLDPAHGTFDYVVAMDSLIHYPAAEIAAALAALAGRTEHGIVGTFAPGTPLLRVMRGVGRLFPQGDRAPAIEPVLEGTLRRRLAADPAMHDWRWTRTERVRRGFYTSQAVELRRHGRSDGAFPSSGQEH
ncbi:MAG TPA: magnesium protoporphyrin IX methyltransferase [Gemmatirosa sp.]|nr:magnesium protoporphyrin IX methyltransferase [Gemmatirosa sp.]